MNAKNLAIAQSDAADELVSKHIESHGLVNVLLQRDPRAWKDRRYGRPNNGDAWDEKKTSVIEELLAEVAKLEELVEKLKSLTGARPIPQPPTTENEKS